MKILVIVLAFLIGCVETKAQTITLTEEEKAELAENTRIRIDGFMADLLTIASKDTKYTPEMKRKIIEHNLKYFLGKGEYLSPIEGEDRKMEYYKDAYENRRIAPYVTITSIRGTKRTVPIRRFLTNLMYIQSRFTIKQVYTFCDVSVLHQVDDHYETIARYCPYFKGNVYIDSKSINIQVIVREIEGKRVFIVPLGNVEVEEY